MKRGTKSFLVAVALPFIGGIATAAATFIGWIAVAVLIWHPFRLHLRRFGMTADDIGFSYLGALGPPYVGGLFVLTTALGLIVFLVVRNGKWCTAVIVFFNLIPGALSFWRSTALCPAFTPSRYGTIHSRKPSSFSWE